MSGNGNNKIKGVKYWALKVFILSLIISAAFSTVTNLCMETIPVWAAILILILIILIGVVFDIIGVAFASCDQKPFISMSSKKIPKAKAALKLLKNADLVSNICNDVVGDICGIVSGAAGAVITLILCMNATETTEIIVSIAVSSFIAAFTISGKAAGKKYAIKYNLKIVERVGAIFTLFQRDK